MKIKFLLPGISLLVLVACNKDNNGQLTIKIKSVSSNVVNSGETLRVIFDFTEKGSVIDSLIMRKIRINQHQTTTIRDTVFLTVPSYPKASKGELQVNLDYDLDLVSSDNPPLIDSVHSESDSLILKFVARDQANHSSDTATTGLIIVTR